MIPGTGCGIGYRVMGSKIRFSKLIEALSAVGPLLLIVLALSLTVASIPSGVMLSFLGGAFLLIIGMGLFSHGVEMSMETMGERFGSALTRTKKLWLIILVGAMLGFFITVSEPDLQVLANQVTSIPRLVLIGAVALGVGLFLTLALLRMLFRIPLRQLLFVSYALVFILAVFTPKEFLAVAFDAGGVTTGPITVPFIMAFGIGISSIRNDKHAVEDSFGLVALCSVGPILAVLLLGLIFRPDSATYAESVVVNVADSIELGRTFYVAFPETLKDVAVAVLPIVVFFGVFQISLIRMERNTLVRIVHGLVYTYVGLVLFLTGANVGFIPAGGFLGATLATLPMKWIIIPIGMLIGYFLVRAEPAVGVLTKQVEEITEGAIGAKSIGTALSLAVAASVGISMLRVLTGIPILYFILPGYAVAILLSVWTPPIFTAIAFDSGGVASGPMTATFLLPLAVGASIAVGGNVVTDAFGLVAMVAMTPLITLQILGIVARMRGKNKEAEHTYTDPFTELPDNAIIEL